MLNEKMLERHLFEMLPNAWKKLHKTVVPPPIPKPVPAYQESVPAQEITASDFPPPISGSGRIIKRRVSMFVGNNHANTDVLNYRQSVLLKKFNAPKNTHTEEKPALLTPKFTIKGKAKSSKSRRISFS